MKITEITFTEKDKKNKGMRKDLNYLSKVFKGDLPKWLVDKVMTIRRKEQSLGSLNIKSVF
jgi:hypothetical protein